MEVLQTSQNSLSCWLVLHSVSSWWLVLLGIWALMFLNCSKLFSTGGIRSFKRRRMAERKPYRRGPWYLRRQESCA